MESIEDNKCRKRGRPIFSKKELNNQINLKDEFGNEMNLCCQRLPENKRSNTTFMVKINGKTIYKKTFLSIRKSEDYFDKIRSYLKR